MAEQSFALPNDPRQPSGTRNSFYGAGAGSSDGGSPALGGVATATAGTGQQPWSGNETPSWLGGAAPGAGSPASPPAMPTTRLGQVTAAGSSPSSGQSFSPWSGQGDPWSAFLKFFGLSN